MQKTFWGAMRLTRSNHKAPVFSQSFSTTYVLWKSHYDVLGVSKNSTDKEIRSAFIDLSKKYHPDNDPTNPDLSPRFIEIKEAYDALSTLQKRRSYDQKMHWTNTSHANMSNEELRTKQYKQQFGHNWKPGDTKDVDETVWTWKLRGKTFVVNPSNSWVMLLIGLTSWVILSAMIYSYRLWTAYDANDAYDASERRPYRRRPYASRRMHNGRIVYIYPDDPVD